MLHVVEGRILAEDLSKHEYLQAPSDEEPRIDATVGTCAEILRLTAQTSSKQT